MKQTEENNKGFAFEQVKMLYIITGISASGKSTLARELSNTKGYPMYSLDDYKQKIYEYYGFRNDTERKILWNMAKHKYQTDIMMAMRKEGTLIVEYPFDSSWQEFFAYISEEYNYMTTVVNCNTRDFEDIWNARVKRDSNDRERPKCLTASSYIKGVLYESNHKINEEYKKKKEQEYKDGKYTCIKGDYVFSDKEFKNIMNKEHNNSMEER